MNRAELVDALAERAELSRREASDIVSAIFHPSEGVIAKALKKGDRVSLTGFGVFGVRKRAARTARNPQTGESIKVAAGKVPGFKAGASFKATVSGKAAAKGGAAKGGAAKSGAAKSGAAKGGTAKGGAAKGGAAKAAKGGR
jgi:DNA-binding protein HU-beta